MVNFVIKICKTTAQFFVLRVVVCWSLHYFTLFERNLNKKQIINSFTWANWSNFNFLSIKLPCKYLFWNNMRVEIMDFSSTKQCIGPL